MKELITNSLKKIKSGAFDTGSTIVFALVIILLVVLFFGSLPAILIWSLGLMGLPVTLTFKSWFGAALFLFVIRTRFSVKNDTKK